MKFEPFSIDWRSPWGTWRGPLLAALITLLAALPGLVFLPPLDRDESRFAQATKQMLETGDFIDISLGGVPRYEKPVGIYWLQAASTAVLGSGAIRNVEGFSPGRVFRIGIRATF